MLLKALSALFGLQMVLAPTITDIPPITQHKPACVSVECQIREVARNFNFPEETAVRIAKCESSLDPQAKNPNSSATGLYQFTIGTWINYCSEFGDRTNIQESTECFIKLYRQHPSWWECK